MGWGEMQVPCHQAAGGSPAEAYWAPVVNNLAGLLPDFAPKSSHDVFIRFKLTAQAVVFAEMLIPRPAVAMDEEHLPSIRRKNVTQGRKDRRV